MKAELNVYLRRPHDWWMWNDKELWCTYAGATEVLCKEGLARKLEIPEGTKKLTIVFSSAKPRHQHYWEIGYTKGKRWCSASIDYVDRKFYTVKHYRGTLMHEAELIIQSFAEEGAKYIWFEVAA